MNITQAIRDQKQELMESFQNRRLIGRDVSKRVEKFLGSRLIKVVTGVRRSGKSVIIYMNMKDKKFAYMNFDDDRLIGLSSEQILPAFYEVYGKYFKYIFLDEIQNLKNWELFVNRLHRTGFNVIITGSNSRLLSKEMATHLTGRHTAIELFPFSFKEYLDSVGFSEDIQTTKGQSLLKGFLKKYTISGGFPEVVVEKEDPKNYTRELYRKIIERDIVERYNISHKKTFREIAVTLLNNPGRMVSYNKLKKQFNLGSEHTVKNYISYLEEAYLIFLLSRFSYKPVEVEKSEKKIYAIDTGFVNSFVYKFSEDHGHVYENLVAIELMRQKSSNHDIDIFYWKNVQHEEVDFVVKNGTNVKQLIQVCYNISDIKTKEIEMRVLLKAGKELRCKNMVVITEDYESEENLEWFGIKGRIKFIPLWKWLLD
ncbi:MAG: ATP-binding protein [Candidatus Aenigmatarchaeota archaeon]